MCWARNACNVLGRDYTCRFPGFRGSAQAWRRWISIFEDPRFTHIHTVQISLKSTFSTTLVSTILPSSRTPKGDVRRKIKSDKWFFEIPLEVSKHGSITWAHAFAQPASGNAVPAFHAWFQQSTCQMVYFKHVRVDFTICSIASQCFVQAFEAGTSDTWLCLLDHFSHLNLGDMFETFLVEDLPSTRRALDIYILYYCIMYIYIDRALSEHIHHTLSYPNMVMAGIFVFPSPLSPFMVMSVVSIHVSPWFVPVVLRQSSLLPARWS